MLENINNFIGILNIFYIFLTSFSNYYFNNFLSKFFYKIEKKERIELIKNIADKLENINIFYVKILQSLCLNDDLLYKNEKDYLIKYTDNVPYNSDDIDYNILDEIQDKYNIYFDNYEPLNSGIIAITFKGIYREDNKKVVIKIIKNNIKNKIEKAFEEIDLFIYILSIIPYIKKLNFKKCLLDNKELLLDQTNFRKEVNNIQIFKEKNINNKEYIIPECYPYITSEYNNVIVMENIKGLTFNDIKDYDEKIKYEFGRLLIKFGIISILYNSAVHCDVHPGNLFFYINEETDLKPKYQIGYIDFGIVAFPSRENQNIYYTFFKDIQIDKDFSEIEIVVSGIVCEKELLKNLTKNKKEDLYNKIKKLIGTTDDSYDLRFFLDLSYIINSFGLSFTKEFNNLCFSLQVVESLSKNLTGDPRKIQDDIILSFNKINKLLEIE